ncbi:MAG TPA: hypothetical protein VHM24_10780 [Gemmatimonadaceae bacterium]|nr:hypothetical protein [Gemmatimonadaceae bacterium]
MIEGPAIAMMAIASCAAASYIVRVIANAVVRYREQDARVAEASTLRPNDERLARLELAVESIAVEVERISEGQRFTTRLLSDVTQKSFPAPERPSRINTPH